VIRVLDGRKILEHAPPAMELRRPVVTLLLDPIRPLG
jgi:hypothetical protein